MSVNLELRTVLTDVLKRAETALADNLMPFWANHTWDNEYGGFLTRLDRRGRWLDTSEKFLMMQVRMIAALSAAHRFGLTDRGYLDLAAKGFEFLIAAMWDHKEGGFYFSVTRDGHRASIRKNTDVHAYVITGLSEFHRASGRADALDWAQRVFDVVITKARDRDLGFIEDFDGGDWSALNDEQMSLGGQRDIKTIDMHTNVLEAFIYLSRITQDEKHSSALRRVFELIVTKGIRRDHIRTITAFDYEWNPVPDGSGHATTSYGINVELAWLMMEAVELLHLSRGRYRGEILGLINGALAYGFDHERGGLAAYGPMTGHVLKAAELGASRLLKSWWAQAETLNALVGAYDWTQNPVYLVLLARLFDWIWRHQIDHEYGDWYQEVQWDTGVPVTTDKGGEFKTAFHAGRALIRVITALRTMLQCPPA